MAQTSAVKPVLDAVYTALNVAGMTGSVSGKTVTVSNDWAQSVSAPACIIQCEAENRDLDTMGKPGKSVLVYVHFFSDYQGQIEIGQMAAAAMSLLNYATVTVASHTLVSVQSQEGFNVGAEDIKTGKRQHWVYPFRVDVKQTTP